MTFQFLCQVSNPDKLTQYCYSLLPLMSADVSSYARGRYRLWLFHEAILGQKICKPAYFDQQLWDFSQKVFPGCNIALLTFGGKHEGINSNACINWHRDDTYATEIARSINFGGEAQFGYHNSRIETRNNPEDFRIITLRNGSIYEFNCKHPHTVISHEPGRFSLILWKMRLNDPRYPGFKLCDRITKLIN